MKKIFILSFLYILSSAVFSQAADYDKVAKFKGKPKNITDFVFKNQQYPNDAWWSLTEGIVEVEGIVTKDGSFIELKIKKSVDPLLDLEALRIAELMQEWKPAKKKKDFVNSKMTIEVPFYIFPQIKKQIDIYKKYNLEDKMPLFVLDNKIVNGKVAIYSYNLKSVRVLKGEKAIEKYGQNATNGVVEMTTKLGTPR